MRVFLLLDDSPDVIAAFLPFLRAIGKAEGVLHKGESAEETAELLLAKQPNIILVDGQLEGGVRGYEVVKLLKERAPSVRCIGFSSAPGLREPFLRAGAVGFVQKNTEDPAAGVLAVKTLVGA
ncbi:MAG: response regulator [Candidatus Peribacteraceae bacterium]|nr:response regulator [Candidatus Peribacteraceae bacterium]